MWKHICLSAGICGSYNPRFTISPLWTSQYLIGAPGPLTSPLAPLAPRPQVQVQQSSAAPQTFVIKQVEPDPPAQEVSNYSKVRRLQSFTMLWVNTRGATLPRSKGFKLSPLSATKAAAASNWSIPSVMVFKNLQTKININWDFMNWTCNITILHS